MWKELEEFVEDAFSRPLDFMGLPWAKDWCGRLGFDCEPKDKYLHIVHRRNAPEKRMVQLEYLESGEAFIPIARQFDEPAVAASELMLGIAIALSFHNGSVSIHGYQGNWRTPYAASYAMQTARFAKSILDPLVRTATCFISYSTRDSDFVETLKATLHREGYRTWYAPEQMRGGLEISQQVDDAIRLHDRFLIVLSRESMRSDWVIHELHTALREEASTGVPQLFPIRLCEMGDVARWKCVVDGMDLGEQVRSYFIPDFSRWEKESAWSPLFKELVQSLAARTTGENGISRRHEGWARA